VAIKNEQSRDTGNIGHTGVTGRRQTKQKRNASQKKISNTDPTINGSWTLVLAKG